mgnify:CR=1 FL=1
MSFSFGVILDRSFRRFSFASTVRLASFDEMKAIAGGIIWSCFTYLISSVGFWPRTRLNGNILISKPSTATKTILDCYRQKQSSCEVNKLSVFMLSQVARYFMLTFTLSASVNGSFT